MFADVLDPRNKDTELIIRVIAYKVAQHIGYGDWRLCINFSYFFSYLCSYSIMKLFEWNQIN